jgi:hypothetical protein
MIGPSTACRKTSRRSEMQELIQRRRERLGDDGPAGLDDDRYNTEPSLVTVACGPYVESLPVGNMTVAEVRARYRDRFDIDPDSQGIVDGTEVGDDTRIRAGQSLAFIRRAGEKG